jgi:hypothetical protein
VCHARLSGNGIIHCDLPESHGARGDVCVGNVSTASRDHLLGNS